MAGSFRLGGLLLAGLLAVAGCVSPAPPATPSATSQSSSTDGDPSAPLELAPSIFKVTYRLDAAVAVSSRVLVDVPAGLSFTSTGRLGADVERGAVIGRIAGDPATVRSLTAPDVGTVGQSRLAVIRTREGVVRAPVSGRLVHSSTPTIRSNGLDLVAELTPLQVLRYRGLAFQAQGSVETVLGQQRVGCSALWIVSGDPKTGIGQLHCRLPASVETAAGLPGILTLEAAEQRSVIAVPLRYVGLDESGANYVVSVVKGGTSVSRPVVVGPTDGVRRVIVSGVQAGDVLAVVGEK